VDILHETGEYKHVLYDAEQWPGGPVGPQAAVWGRQSATATIPIVFVAVFDPVAVGYVQSLSRLGSNNSILQPTRQQIGLESERTPGIEVFTNDSWHRISCSSSRGASRDTACCRSN
jgi:hypothetical protein